METESKKQTITCEHCGKTFEAEIFESVDITNDHDGFLRVMAGDFDEVVCPHCGETVKTNSCFTIVDTEKKYELLSGPCESFISLWFDGYKETKKQGLETIRKIGAISLFDRCEKLTALEHDLDYRVMEIYKIMLKASIKDSIKKDHMDVEYITELVTFIETDTDDRSLAFVTCFDYRSDGSDEIKIFKKIYLFNVDFYNMILNKQKEHLDNKDLFDFYFDENLARKFFEDRLKEPHSFYVAEVLIPYEENICYAIIGDYNVNKFNNGDRVVIRHNEGTDAGFILKIFETNTYEFPIGTKELARVAWHYEPIQLTTTGSSGDELDNAELLKTLKVFGKGTDVLLRNADVITLVCASVSLEDALDILKNDNVANDKVKIVFKSEKIDGKNYLCVYTNQDATKAKDREMYSDFIYGFDDIVKVVLFEPKRYQGIVVNYETDRIILKTPRLLRYKYQSIMCDSDAMKNLYGKLTKEEKEYLGEYYLDLITEPYLSKKKWDPEETAKRWNKTRDEIEDDLDVGYLLLKQIVVDNY